MFHNDILLFCYHFIEKLLSPGNQCRERVQNADGLLPQYLIAKVSNCYQITKLNYVYIYTYGINIRKI